MASIKNLFFPTLLGILLLNCGAKAKDMTDFIETFSGICFQSLATFDNARAILRYQGWKELDDEAISTLGRPVDPNAIVEGYAISTSSQQNAYLLALTSIPNSKQRVCTLVPGSDEDYEKNTKQLKEFFEVKKISESNEGIVKVETWAINHPFFDEAFVISQKYRNRDEKADLGQFHLIGMN